jgi:hypothetical protein
MLCRFDILKLTLEHTKNFKLEQLPRLADPSHCPYDPTMYLLGQDPGSATVCKSVFKNFFLFLSFKN